MSILQSRQLITLGLVSVNLLGISSYFVWTQQRVVGQSVAIADVSEENKEPILVKLEDGTTTAYPDLKPKNFEDFKTKSKLLQAGPITWPKEAEASTLLKLQRAQFEQLRLCITSQLKVMETGSWDIAFLVAFTTDIRDLALLCRDVYPEQADRVKWLRECLMLQWWVRDTVLFRVQVVANIRPQVSNQMEARRYELEVLLLKTESEVRK